ncbi:hypothetical protein CEQ90_01645 [Lewinellaceae bacterium SD302]|nr:hypothetical protein CEQ90_01645 [Lewinellaceae bacterium SD302]
MKSIFFIVLVLLGFADSAPDSIALKLTSTAPGKGVIRLAVFDDADALAREEPVSGQVIELVKNKLPIQLKLSDLPEGDFAIAAYHDLNNDGKLNRNFFGVPSEPYAFSGVPASKWRAPEWEEVIVSGDRRKAELSLELKFWKEQ